MVLRVVGCSSSGGPLPDGPWTVARSLMGLLVSYLPFVFDRSKSSILARVNCTFDTMDSAPRRSSPTQANDCSDCSPCILAR